MVKGLILAAWLGSVGLDAASTHYGLTKGGHEFFMTQNPSVNYVIMGSQAVVGSYVFVKWSKRHPKVAVIVLLGIAAVRVAVAVHNFKVVN